MDDRELLELAPESCALRDSDTNAILAWEFGPDELIAFGRAAFAAGRLAGMKEAAGIAAEVADRLTPMGAAFYCGAAKSADAIRAANGREGKA